MTETRAGLEHAIGYRFQDDDLLEEALTHPSHTAENDGEVDYDRLEFLGDAVLQLAVTRFLYEVMPDGAEGEMTLVRAGVVSEPMLADVARAWGVPEAVRLGKGEEQTGGREKDSILGDVVEALIGVIYLESGLEAAEAVVRRHWADVIEERAETPGGLDYKTRLQEILVAEGRSVRYQVTDTGPQHAKEFTATLLSNGMPLATGHGTSKKRAEQDAARRALRRLATPDS